MAMDHVFIARCDLQRQDMPRHAGGESQLAGPAQGAVLGHKQAAAAGNSLECAKEAPASGELRVGGHLDVGGHPGKLARLGNDGVVVLELELEYRHGGASDAVLHANRVMGAGHIRQQKSGWGDLPAAAHLRSSTREACRSRIPATTFAAPRELRIRMDLFSTPSFL